MSGRDCAKHRGCARTSVYFFRSDKVTHMKAPASRYTAMALAVVAALSLSACHHGSGHSSSNDEPEPEPMPVPVPPGPEPEDASYRMQGQLLLGYVSGAKLCVDLDYSLSCDKGEPAAQTDETGRAVLPLTDEQKSAIEKNGSARLLAHVPAGSPNRILGKDGAATASDMVLTATVFSPEIYEDGKEPGGDPARVTPFTTLADTTLDPTAAAGISQDEYESRIGKLAESLGVSKDAVLGDYNDPGTVTDDGVRAIVADEMLVSMGYMPQSFEQLQAQSATVNDIETLAGNMESANANTDEIMAALPEHPATAGDLGAVADQLETRTAKMKNNFVGLSSGKGEEFRCAVNQLGNAYCWGINAWANLGDPALFRDDSGNYYEDGSQVVDLFSHKPVMVMTEDGSPLTNVKQIETGRRFACAVTMSGGVWCWGDSYYGQTGTGKLGADAPYTYAATRVKAPEGGEGYLSGITGISMARDAACALGSDGGAYCWGNNTARQLGGDSRHDQTAPYSSVRQHDGSAMPEGFAVKAVPYPVPITLPGDLKITSIAAGEWAFCALADVSAASDKHNLYCWGNDTRSLFHNIDDYLPKASDNIQGHEPYVDEDAADALRSVYAKYADLDNGRPEYNPSNPFADGSGYLWKYCSVKAKEGEDPTMDEAVDRAYYSALWEEYNRTRKLVQRVNYQGTQYYSSTGIGKEYSMANRDWLVHDGSEQYNPLYSTGVTRVDSAMICVKDFENPSSACKTLAKVELADLTDVSFSYPKNTGSVSPEQYEFVDPVLRSLVHDGHGYDSLLMVGLYTADNSRIYKRWYSVGSRIYEESRDQVNPYIECGYYADAEGKPADKETSYTNTYSFSREYADPYNFDASSAYVKVWERYGEQLANNCTAKFDEHAELVGVKCGGDSGKPEMMRCETDPDSDRRWPTLVCDSDFARIDGGYLRTEDDNSTITVSDNGRSSCTLAVNENADDPEDATGNTIVCTGANLFGQAGALPSDTEYSNDEGATWNTASYTGVSFSDYALKWLYAPGFYGIPGYIDSDSDEYRETESDLEKYLSHFTVGYFPRQSQNPDNEILREALRFPEDGSMICANGNGGAGVKICK